MISTTQTPIQTLHAGHGQASIVIRALSSINSEQASTIAGIAQASGQSCDVHIIDDYDGYRSILVEPNAAESSSTGYFVSGTAQRLDLFEASEDHLTPIGCFSHVDDLTAKLVSLLGGSK